MHAGDMGQFEALVARRGGGAGGAGSAASESLKLKHRRAAFKTNGQVWELQAKSFAACAIFYEADRGPQSEDVAFFKGYAKLQVLQPNHRLELKTYAHLRRQAKESEVDPVQAGILLPSLIQEHVEGPRPELVSKQVDDRLDTYMTFPALGRSNASTFYTGQLVRQSDSLADVKPFWSTRTMIKVPCELLQLEVWVPSGWSDPSSVFAEAFGCSSAPEQALESREADRIDVYPMVQAYRGVLSDEPPPSPEIEKWAEVVESVVRKHGLLGQRFDVYRCRVKYPVLHSVVRLRVEAFQRA
jgi:hypothetical protein